MRVIYKIAKSELGTLFYSPIAWLILVIFVFQVLVVLRTYWNIPLTRKLLDKCRGTRVICFS